MKENRKMKIVLSLFMFVALSFATTLTAQEESPQPSATPEPSSPIIEAPSTLRETPAPAAEEKKSTPAPETKKTEATKASKSEPAAEKKTSSAEKTEKASPAATGPDKGSAESNIKRLENDWEASVMKKDPAFLKERIANDFIGTSPKGKRMNKAGILKEFKGDTDSYTSSKNGSITVRPCGPNVAVAVGSSKEVGKTKEGQAFNRTYLWTDVWMLRNGRWECVVSHDMLQSGK
jgi:ketosteroid isomerase-like protein